MLQATSNLWLFALILALLTNCYFPHTSIVVTAIDLTTSAYHAINIAIVEEDMPKERCEDILAALEHTLIGASKTLYAALDSRYYFGDFNIFLPQNWDDTCIPQIEAHRFSGNKTGDPSSIESHPKRRSHISSGGSIDITITNTHTLLGDSIWTQQYGGCGVPGQQIYASYKSLYSPHSGKEFVREWAKYRYGVFDEIGYQDDPIYTSYYYLKGLQVTGCTDYKVDLMDKFSGSIMYLDYLQLISDTARTSLMFAPQCTNVAIFCNADNHNRYAPTKHNYMCDRRSTLDVILQHSDFDSKNSVAKAVGSQTVNTTPAFIYRRRSKTRFVVVIDNSLDILQRESWSFLRSAFRKWVVHDLMSNTEVGVVLVNGRIVEKSLDLTQLTNITNRDLVASFLPYMPSDSRQVICIKCAINEALNIIERRNLKHGNASCVIVIVAPGMDKATNVSEVYNIIRKRTEAVVATITYPELTSRKPLDSLALSTNGISFSVHESKLNSEKSYLTTYFQLSNALSSMGQYFYEGDKSELPLEIHRNEIYDSSNNTNLLNRSTRQINGYFHLEKDFGLPAGFFIYIHSTETPLIQSVRVTSPSGSVFSSRSDQRMPVKQITLMAPLTEAGLWQYEIERYPGNPQPHIVQVMATPRTNAHVKAHSWVRRTGSGHDSIFSLYSEVKYGKYPVRNALVHVTVDYRDTTNNSVIREVIELKDSGSGDSDIVHGDGIYSRNIRVYGPGCYIFDFYVKENSKGTYRIKAKVNESGLLNSTCCGSHMAPVVFKRDTQKILSNREPSTEIGKFTTKIGPFERYGPMLTVYVNQLEFTSNDKGRILNTTDTNMDIQPYHQENNIVSGRILDLTATYHKNILYFNWTSLDISGLDIVKYELRYAPTLVDIIDNFDAMRVIASQEISLPKKSGTEMNYIFDISRIPEIYGKFNFFAIRPHNKWHFSIEPGPLSNVVNINIPAAEIASPYPPTDHQSTTFVKPNKNQTSNDTYTNTSVLSGQGSPLDQLRFTLPFCLSLLLVFLIFILICFIKRCRRKSVEGRTKITIPTQSPQDLTPAHKTLQTVNSNISMHNYSIFENICADHHTIGIPVYANGSSKRRVSTSGSQEFEELNAPIYPMHTRNDSLVSNIVNQNGFYKGVSIISNDLRIQQHPLDVCKNWTAVEVLSDCQQSSSTANSCAERQFVFDQLSMECAPPVPPLPMQASIHNFQQYPAHMYDYYYDLQQLPQKKIQPPRTNSTISVSTPMCQSQISESSEFISFCNGDTETPPNNPSVIYNQATTQSVPDNVTFTGFGDRRLRNVTMV